jgi:dipeptidyl aminopeptidase/acylaminoacyl peptidase
VIDVLNLIPLAQQLPEARPGKVGIWGHSNGGAITAKVITVSDQIAAAVIYSPASSNIVEDYQFRVERRRAKASRPASAPACSTCPRSNSPCRPRGAPTSTSDSRH